MSNQLATTEIPAKYTWKGNKKQKMAMDYWLSPTSKTFGNAYKSFKLAGFSESYSKNIVGQAPRWISEYLDRTSMTEEHIAAGIQELALAAPDSRSPDDTRLKAYETLAKIRGMVDGKHTTNVTLVQPILSHINATNNSNNTQNTSESPGLTSESPHPGTHIEEAELIP